MSKRPDVPRITDEHYEAVVDVFAWDRRSHSLTEYAPLLADVDYLLRLLSEGKLGTYDPTTQFVGSRSEAGIALHAADVIRQANFSSQWNPRRAAEISEIITRWLTPESPSPDTTTESR